MSPLELAELLWPAMFVLGLLLTYLTVSPSPSTGLQQYLPSAGAVVGIILLYESARLRGGIRWLLTLVGFALPLVVSLVAVRYIVEEV